MNIGDFMNIQEIFQNGYMTPVIEWMGEQIPGGFFIYRADESEKILYVNNATLRIFGCETEDRRHHRKTPRSGGEQPPL